MENKGNGNRGTGFLMVLLFFGGAALIAAGLWRVSITAGLIFCGLVLLYFGLCLSRVYNAGRKDRDK